GMGQGARTGGLANGEDVLPEGSANHLLPVNGLRLFSGNARKTIMDKASVAIPAIIASVIRGASSTLPITNPPKKNAPKVSPKITKTQYRSKTRFGLSLSI